MRSHLIDILACPDCGAPLTLQDQTIADGEIASGELVCGKCRRSFPIRKGIPRFAANGDNYAENFGWQWNRFRRTQIDRFNGTTESEKRFRHETGWMPEDLPGSLVLDAGCGAGRFTAIAAEWGARVVAVDLADAAAEACAQNMREMGLHVDVVQASLFNLPFRPASFDRVFSLGVLQHTPDPRKAIQALPGFLKPGGVLAYWIYEKRWYRWLMVRNHLRLLTRNWSTKTNWRLSAGLACLFFPAAVILSLLPGARKLQPFLPISSRLHWGKLSLRQAWDWTLLDTFDSYSASFEHNQREEDVRSALAEAGVQDIRRTEAKGMAITGKKAAQETHGP